MKTSRQAVSPDSGLCVDAKTQTRYRRKVPPRVKQAFVSVLSAENKITSLKATIPLRRFAKTLQATNLAIHQNNYTCIPVQVDMITTSWSGPEKIFRGRGKYLYDI